MTRRQRGEGSVSQRCDTTKGCPPLVDGQRPEHRCTGLWVGMIDLGERNGKRRRKAVYGKTQAEAIRKLNKTKRDIAQHGISDSRPPTVAEWLDHWLTEVAGADNRQSTIDGSYRSKVARACETIGGTRLDRLEPSDLRRLYAQMGKECGYRRRCRLSEAEHDEVTGHPYRPRAKASIMQTHRILARAFTIAVRDGKMTRNPAAHDRMEPPRVGSPKVETEAMSVPDLFALLDYIKGDRLESRWLFAISVGARQGELLGLGWEDVDWEARVVRINRALARVKGEGLRFVDPKSKKSQRSLPLSPGLLDALARRYEVFRAETQIEGYAYRPAEYGPLAPSGLVWGHEDGRPRDGKQDWKDWAAALSGAGVPHCGTHAARHTVATLLSNRFNAPAKVTQAILGHAQIGLTMDTYTHAEAEAARPYLDALDDLYTNRPAIEA